ncbi:SOUL heme-binding protein-domain-containing protein [Haematococcus lacustris]
MRSAVRGAAPSACSSRGLTPRPMRRGRHSLLAAQTPAASQRIDLEERMAFLRADLPHLFDNQGIDASAYDSVVDFRDPITRYTSLQGYLFNIAFLKRVFQPTFQLHDIRPAGDSAVISRWTMAMDFLPARLLPTERWWAPQLIFTGTSTYHFNPRNAKIDKHIDTWDSINNQEFFSLEAFLDFLRGLTSTHSVPPGLEQPEYTVLRRHAGYSVRRYRPFLAVQTALDAAAAGGSTQVDPAGPGGQAFGRLARFIFGGNASAQKMAMTAPVFTSSQGVMQFVIGSSAHQALSTVPAPLAGAEVEAVEEGGGCWAVRTFGGLADTKSVQQQAQQLKKELERDGVAYQEAAGWKLARYNDPGTPGWLRRNEVMVPLVEPFELWRPGELP